VTHAEAINRSREALGIVPDCGHKLTSLGQEADGVSNLWRCPECQVVLLIDPTGVIRDTRPVHKIKTRRMQP
jgi:hypothetical protein